METKCPKCGCLEPNDEKHVNTRDCLIAVVAAKGQVKEDRKTSERERERGERARARARERDRERQRGRAYLSIMSKAVSSMRSSLWSKPLKRYIEPLMSARADTLARADHLPLTRRHTEQEVKPLREALRNA